MRHASKDDHEMKDLVAVPVDIMAIWIPFLWYSHAVDCRSCQVEYCHERHPIEAHAHPLSPPAIQIQAMSERYDR